MRCILKITKGKEVKMKKLVCAAMAAVLAGGFIFAQDAAETKKEVPTVKVTGGISSGVTVNKDGSKDATVSVYNTDIGKAARAWINFDLTGENYGFSSQLRADSGTVKDIPYFKYIYGYGTLLQNILPVTVKGGFLFEDIWGVGFEGLGTTYGYASGPAVVVNIKPIQIKGLEFGAGLMDFGTSGWSGKTISKDYLTVGAKYAMEGVFAVGAQYKFGKGTDAWNTSKTYSDGALMASVSVDAVKNLSLSAEGEITSITTDNPYYMYDEYASYKFTDKITADIIAMQFVTDKIYTFEPTVSYSFTDNFSVKLIGGDFITQSGDATDNDWYIMPGVILTAGKAKIALYYAYATAAAPDSGNDYNYYYYGAGSNIMLNYKFTF
jgi:hypothetical protein